MQSQILKILYDIKENHINVDRKLYQKQSAELINCQKSLLEALGDNKELKNMIFELDDLYGEYHGILETEYYKSGFICGARIALEICGINMDE